MVTKIKTQCLAFERSPVLKFICFHFCRYISFFIVSYFNSFHWCGIRPSDGGRQPAISDGNLNHFREGTYGAEASVRRHWNELRRACCPARRRDRGDEKRLVHSGALRRVRPRRPGWDCAGRLLSVRVRALSYVIATRKPSLEMCEKCQTSIVLFLIRIQLVMLILMVIFISIFHFYLFDIFRQLRVYYTNLILS